jgi:hypothetical protein
VDLSFSLGCHPSTEEGVNGSTYRTYKSLPRVREAISSAISHLIWFSLNFHRNGVTETKHGLIPYMKVDFEKIQNYAQNQDSLLNYELLMRQPKEK